MFVFLELLTVGMGQCPDLCSYMCIHVSWVHEDGRVTVCRYGSCTYYLSFLNQGRVPRCALSAGMSVGSVAETMNMVWHVFAIPVVCQLLMDLRL